MSCPSSRRSIRTWTLVLNPGPGQWLQPLPPQTRRSGHQGPSQWRRSHARREEEFRWFNQHAQPARPCCLRRKPRLPSNPTGLLAWPRLRLARVRLPRPSLPPLTLPRTPLVGRTRGRGRWGSPGHPTQHPRRHGGPWTLLGVHRGRGAQATQPYTSAHGVGWVGWRTLLGRAIIGLT